MAARKKREERPLPPPLPPAQRTVGQLVGEAIRAYAAQFWRALALGIPVVVANELVWARPAGDGSIALRSSRLLPIATSGSVGGATSGAFRVEAMEGFGVLRACAQAGIPAVEIRAISNEIAEGDRSRWRIGRALETLADAIPRVLEAVAE